MSRNGRYIVFTSSATDLVAADTNNGHDIFVRDTCLAASAGSPKTTRVSVALDGTAPAGRSDGPVNSQDGRVIVFVATSNRLLPRELKGTSDLVRARTGVPRRRLRGWLYC